MPLEGCFPLAPTFDHAGPMGRDVWTCARMLEALAPGFQRIEPVAWLELAEPLVRERVQAAAELFPHRRELAFPLPEGIGAVRFTYPFNALGWPALALPCGLAEDGLPASVQLVAPAGEDARVLAAGLALERQLGARPHATGDLYA